MFRSYLADCAYWLEINANVTHSHSVVSAIAHYYMPYLY